VVKYTIQKEKQNNQKFVYSSYLLGVELDIFGLSMSAGCNITQTTGNLHKCLFVCVYSSCLTFLHCVQ
jgi:hypothetical protein